MQMRKKSLGAIGRHNSDGLLLRYRVVRSAVTDKSTRFLDWLSSSANLGCSRHSPYPTDLNEPLMTYLPMVTGLYREPSASFSVFTCFFVISALLISRSG